MGKALSSAARICTDEEVAEAEAELAAIVADDAPEAATDADEG